ncbi:MBL fold metallo-hydrolase [Aquirufa sp.]|uniref:MBL fold metallo-hydrolase n=1 Tax=Aquirufa sp. TaxID=2676249 RepID=UPI0037BEA2A2
MIYQQAFTCNPFQENTYFVWDDAGNGVVIDPGCYTYAERKVMQDFIESKSIKLQYILNTHAHIDHILGVAYFQQTYKIPFCLHPLDKPLLDDASNRAEVYGFPHYQTAMVDRWFVNNEQIQVGAMKFNVLFVPGHAPGHVAFYEASMGWVFDGDVLFKQSIGRTDFPLCNHTDLLSSIKNQLYTLPEETLVFPGHGPATSIAEEKMNNPFVKA